VFDSRDLRAAALCFGLAGIGAWPEPKGAFLIEDTAHILGCYRYDLPDIFIVDALQVTGQACAGPSIANESAVGPSVSGESCVGPSISAEASE